MKERVKDSAAAAMEPHQAIMASSHPNMDADSAASESRRSARPSRKRLLLAFVIAAISDVVGAFATPAPPLVWGLDLLTGVVLFAVLGWRWLLLPGLVMEAIPGVGVLPLWLLVVAGIALWGTARPREWLRSGVR
jgi:hypothetical protein